MNLRALWYWLKCFTRQDMYNRIPPFGIKWQNTGDQWSIGVPMFWKPKEWGYRPHYYFTGWHYAILISIPFLPYKDERIAYNRFGYEFGWGIATLQARISTSRHRCEWRVIDRRIGHQTLTRDMP